MNRSATRLYRVAKALKELNKPYKRRLTAKTAIALVLVFFALIYALLF